MPPPGCKIEPNPRHTVIKFAKLFCGFKRNKLALINDNAVLSTYKSPIEKSRYFTDPFRGLFRPPPRFPPTSATRPSSTSTLQMSMCYFPNGRRRRVRPLETEAVRGREGGGRERGAHLCFMPLYLLQMFSDTINSAAFFPSVEERGKRRFLSPPLTAARSWRRGS